MVCILCWKLISLNNPILASSKSIWCLLAFVLFSRFAFWMHDSIFKVIFVYPSDLYYCIIIADRCAHTTIVVKIMGQLNANEAELNIIKAFGFCAMAIENVANSQIGQKSYWIGFKWPRREKAKRKKLWPNGCYTRCIQFRNGQKNRSRKKKHTRWNWAHSLAVNLTSFLFLFLFLSFVAQYRAKIVPFLAIMRWIECNDANDRHHLYWLMWMNKITRIFHFFSSL